MTSATSSLSSPFFRKCIESIWVLNNDLHVRTRGCTLSRNRPEDTSHFHAIPRPYGIDDVIKRE